MNANVGKATALAGSIVIIGVGACATVPSLVVSTSEQPVDVQEATGQAVGASTVSVRSVEGSFSYDQNVVTSNASISKTFAKAAAVLCESLPRYGAAPMAAITVGADGGWFSATVEEMADDEGAQGRVLGCACASNVAGGGAIANAEVSGASFESIAHLAGV